MRITLISVGDKMPAWIKTGWDEYSKRMPRDCALQLQEIAPGKRLKTSSLPRTIAEEGQRMLSAIKPGNHVVTLDLSGAVWSTHQLSIALQRWRDSGQDVSLLVGGPDGLDATCHQRADESWCLSPLTFPHPLVRVIVAEQLYRAWSLLNNHPYHR